MIIGDILKLFGFKIVKSENHSFDPLKFTNSTAHKIGWSQISDFKNNIKRLSFNELKSGDFEFSAKPISRTFFIFFVLCFAISAQKYFIEIKENFIYNSYVTYLFITLLIILSWRIYSWVMQNLLRERKHKVLFSENVYRKNDGKFVELDRVSGIQLTRVLRKQDRGVYYYCFELNFVLNNLERVNIILTSDYENLENMSNKIAAKLKIPIWNQVNVVRTGRYI